MFNYIFYPSILAHREDETTGGDTIATPRHFVTPPTGKKIAILSSLYGFFISQVICFAIIYYNAFHFLFIKTSFHLYNGRRRSWSFFSIATTPFSLQQYTQPETTTITNETYGNSSQSTTKIYNFSLTLHLAALLFLMPEIFSILLE